ncbi:hypothetical protein [Hymenobacter sp. NBH84]|uniref:hypothetical protein n=1 Tax=Hymenobacter sp. NBH84 TaxID=2596915 RepID=UPI001626ED3A|nr:hypothetical protein [Hymenobacter sp. NBH84]
MKQKILAFLLFLPGLGYHAAAQTGCTDARATNFAPSATSNDGSCRYPATTAALPIRAALPLEVHETSGLIYTNQQLWTLNDSGNEPVLYRLDPATGEVRQRVRISNFANVDWEDLTADDRYLYIGDFGNNAGNRRDLRVLRVPKAAIGTAPDITVSAEAIAFSYPQQTNFQPPVNQHNFDAEAFFRRQRLLAYFHEELGRSANQLLHRAGHAGHLRGPIPCHAQRKRPRDRGRAQCRRYGGRAIGLHRHGCYVCVAAV